MAQQHSHLVTAFDGKETEAISNMQKLPDNAELSWKNGMRRDNYEVYGVATHYGRTFATITRGTQRPICIKCGCCKKQ